MSLSFPNITVLECICIMLGQGGKGIEEWVKLVPINMVKEPLTYVFQVVRGSVAMKFSQNGLLFENIKRI